MTAVMETMPKRKGGNPAWVKGVSGNPSGKPRSFSELRNKLLKGEALARKRLMELVGSENERTALEALALYYAYAMGKPAEAMDLAKLDAMADRMRSFVAEVVRKELPEPVQEPVTKAGRLAPEAADAVPVQDAPVVSAPPVSSPVPYAATRCLYRLASGPCETSPILGEQWCAEHKAKLFGMLSAK